jgi:hypothetical protein
MPHSRVPSGEISRRGQTLYDERIRPLVETEENIGKLVAIDVETGDFAISDDMLTAADHMLAKNPDAALYGVRIGYNAVYALGGSLRRTDQGHAWTVE